MAYSDKADLILLRMLVMAPCRLFAPQTSAGLAARSASDADNIRIDPRNGDIVVGYGDGGLAIIDP